MNLKFAFWTPGSAPSAGDPIFGCASHGLLAPGFWIGPDEPGLAFASARFKGQVLTGRYGEVLERLPHIPFAPRGAIVLFTCGVGVETFLERWRRLLPEVPVVGGAAARSVGQDRGELVPATEEVAVLLLSEGEWKVETMNPYETRGPAWELRQNGPRSIEQLRKPGESRWESASTAFRALQTEFGYGSNDCESLTFSDLNGRNLHCSLAGECLHVGADLPAQGGLFLRTITPAQVAQQLNNFCEEPNAVVFACAGLRGLVNAPPGIGKDTLVGFMFGELVTLANRPQFGNLMVARLAPK